MNSTTYRGKEHEAATGGSRSITAWDKFAGLAVGVYGSANLAQGVNIGSAEALLRPMTLVMLPTVMVLGVLTAMIRPERLRGTWPMLLLVVALIPTFGYPTLSGTYFEAEASALRVLLLVCLPMWCAAVLVRSTEAVDFLLLGLLVGSLLVGVGLLSNPVRDAYNAALQSGRVDTIATGVACGVGALILLSWSLRPRTLPVRLVTLGGACALGLATILTLSRQATLILALGIPLLVFVLSRQGWRRRWLVTLGLLMGSYVVWFGLSEGRLSSSFNRTELWAPALDAIWSNPLGVGWGNYFTVVDTSFAYEARYPHNLAIQAFLEGGLVFGVTLLAVLVWAGLCGWRLRALDCAATLGVVWIALLLSASVSSDITGARGIAVASGALIGVAAANRRDHSKGIASHRTSDTATTSEPSPGIGVGGRSVLVGGVPVRYHQRRSPGVS